MRKIGIVWNPSKVDGDTLRSSWDDAVASAGLLDADIEVEWFETSLDDPGRSATDDALRSDCTTVVAAGGDGTVRAVAERLGGAAGLEPAPDGVRLGIVPLGTGNLLARNLDVPLGDAQAAFRRVLADDPAPLDLGEIEVETWQADESGESPASYGFVVMAGFGIDAQMIAETDDDLKAKTGWLAYVESLGRAVAGTQVVDLELRRDGETSQERAHTLLIANCGSIQGGITLLPDAAPDDGELDLLMLGADSLTTWLDTLRDLTWDSARRRFAPDGEAPERAERSDVAQQLRATELQVRLASPLAFEVDGDEIGEVSSFTARILPAALLVL